MWAEVCILLIRALSAPLRIGILGSTQGTNMQHIINAIEAGTLAARIVVCVSDKKGGGILDRAKKYRIKAVHIKTASLDGEEFDAKVLAAILHHGYLLYLIG
jgi:phosphoribosylglycinamide formyltransferase 1